MNRPILPADFARCHGMRYEALGEPWVICRGCSRRTDPPHDRQVYIIPPATDAGGPRCDSRSPRLQEAG